MPARSEPRPVARQWLWYGVEAGIALLAVVWLVSAQAWALLLWEAVATAFLVLGFVAVWPGTREGNSSPRSARRFAALAWILPLAASLAGGSAALTALTRGPVDGPATPDQVLLAVAASVGVVIAWAMLHVGFADIYQSLDESGGAAPGIAFRGDHPDAFLNYLYLAFTIGTAFATSDAPIDSYRIRRVALVHSIVGFLYNAVIVAAAVSVIQRLASR